MPRGPETYPAGGRVPRKNGITLYTIYAAAVATNRRSRVVMMVIVVMVVFMIVAVIMSGVIVMGMILTALTCLILVELFP
jgi:hypothetical protein